MCESITQANCKDRPYLWRQIRSSLAKSSEACKAWAPSGDSTSSWWCKSRCVRPPEKTCIIQPWFRKNGYPTPSEHGFRPHEKQSKSHNGPRGGYPTPQSHGCYGRCLATPSIGVMVLPMDASCREVWVTGLKRLVYRQWVSNPIKWPMLVLSHNCAQVTIGTKTVVQRSFLLAQSLLHNRSSTDFIN